MIVSLVSSILIMVVVVLEEAGVEAEEEGEAVEEDEEDIIHTTMQETRVTRGIRGSALIAMKSGSPFLSNKNKESSTYVMHHSPKQ